MTFLPHFTYSTAINASTQQPTVSNGIVSYLLGSEIPTNNLSQTTFEINTQSRNSFTHCPSINISLPRHPLLKCVQRQSSSSISPSQLRLSISSCCYYIPPVHLLHHSALIPQPPSHLHILFMFPRRKLLAITMVVSVVVPPPSLSSD